MVTREEQQRRADERKAEAEANRLLALAARPFVEAQAFKVGGAAIRKLTEQKVPTYEDMLDIRAELRIIQAQLRAVDSTIKLETLIGGDSNA